MISVKTIRAGNGGGVARYYAADVVDDRAIMISSSRPTSSRQSWGSPAPTI